MRGNKLIDDVNDLNPTIDYSRQIKNSKIKISYYLVSNAE